MVSLAGDPGAAFGAGIAARGRSGVRRRSGLSGTPAGLRLGAPDAATGSRSGPGKLPLWLKIVTVVWIAALVIGGGWYALHGKPSVREQTTIGNARPVVDRAIVDVVAAAGGGPVVAVSGFDRIKTCKITPVRSGAEFRRVVDLYTSPGTESAILHMIASGLPARYHARAGSSGKPHARRRRRRLRGR